MRIRQIALATALLLLVAATNQEAQARRSGIEGSGNLETRVLDLDTFVAVELGGAFDLTIAFGDEQKVEATLDDNLFANLEADVSGRKLALGWDEDCDPSRGCEIRITMVDLEGVELNGAGDVQIKGFAGDRLEIELRGAGDVEADGEVGDLKISLLGAGDIEARDLKAQHVTVVLAGVGDCEVYAAESIDAKLTGVGDLEYWGGPERRETKVSGIGDIKAK
jgi:hypothetical protein